MPRKKPSPLVLLRPLGAHELRLAQFACKAAGLPDTGGLLASIFMLGLASRDSAAPYRTWHRPARLEFQSIFCDGILMVVRSNVTPSDMARRAREEFPDKMLLGVVLNGTGSDVPRSKYYYGEAVTTEV